MQYFVQWRVNFDGLCLSRGTCLVIFCWFSPFLHFSLTHSRPLRVDSQTLCTNMQRISNAKAIPVLVPIPWMLRGWWVWSLSLAQTGLLNLTAPLVWWLIRAQAVGSAPTCRATFFIANPGCSNNTHVSILGHCLQAQTNKNERMEICYQPALSHPSQKQLSETTLLERIRMDNCSKYLKNILLSARDFTFLKRKVNIWHFLYVVREVITSAETLTLIFDKLSRISETSEVSQCFQNISRFCSEELYSYGCLTEASLNGCQK